MEAVATRPVRSVTDTASHLAEPAAAITPDPSTADGPAPDRSGTVWELAHHPASAGAARRITRAALRAWNVNEETTDRALLVVSGLVSNASKHTLPRSPSASATPPPTRPQFEALVSRRPRAHRPGACGGVARVRRIRSRIPCRIRVCADGGTVPCQKATAGRCPAEGDPRSRPGVTVAPPSGSLQARAARTRAGRPGRASG